MSLRHTGLIWWQSTVREEDSFKDQMQQRVEVHLPGTHADEQGRDGSTVFQVDHGQQVRQVALSGP